MRTASRVLHLLVIGAVAAALLPAQAAAEGPPSKPFEEPTDIAIIDAGLAEQLESGDTVRFVVTFRDRADLSAASSIENFSQRGRAVVNALQATARRSQARAKQTVAAAGATAEAFWFHNVMVVDGDAALAETLARLPSVRDIQPERFYPLVEPLEPEAAITAAVGDPEWGVAQIGADQVWGDGILGQGIVVANIDTGVDYTHPALVSQYRGNNGAGSFVHDYNWWDGTSGGWSAVCAVPCDVDGHGTHVMGTMVGGDGPGPFSPDIGVAPGAKWIAARGCDLSCPTTALLSAGQWIMAPTDLNGQNPDPAKRPHIVNNSWGGGPGDDWYQETVDTWRAAGIIPVFSAGNSGPSCETGGSPGDLPGTFSVGATDASDVIADFSSRGPSPFGNGNPDVSAPGVSVKSSIPGGGYGVLSGTSMAAPHVSGALALMLSSAPHLIGNVDAATQTIAATAFDIVDLTCGGDPDGDPNNVYGDGRIDVAAAAALAATRPAAARDDYVSDEDIVLDVAAPGVLDNDYNPNGGPMVASPVTLPANGTLVLNPDGSFSYTPERDFCGIDAYTYLASDGSASSNIAVVEIEVRCVGDLEISKTATPGTVFAGNVITYTLDVVNESPETLTAVTVTDDVPPNTSFVVGSATCGGAESGGVVTFSLGVMAPGESSSCSFAVVVDAGLSSAVDFEDDMESGDAQWSTAAGSGSSNWALVTADNTNSPTHAWLATDVATVTDQYLTSTPFVSTGLALTFWHRYATWTRRDGGVVEASTDAGASWTDLGPHMTANGYNDVISVGGGSSIEGRPAFTGDSGGYVQSEVDLASFAGETIQIRFRMATDWFYASPGWWVDDVVVGGVAYVSNTACATSAEGEAACDTARTRVEPGLAISKTATPDRAFAGHELTYTIDVMNQSPGELTEVKVTDAVPPNTSYVPGSATCGGAELGGVVTFALGALAPGESTTCSFAVVVDAGFTSAVDFEDDMESGDASWTTAAGQGWNNWTLMTADNATSPTHAWFAADVRGVTDQYLTTTPFVSSGGPLVFWHHFDTQDRYNGGVVEISSDGGATWIDLGPHITSNGYTDVIVGDNPIEGRPAFAGDSGGYVRTEVDLSDFTGDTIQIRFRLATERYSGANGWWVDDVAVGGVGYVSNTACVASAEGEAACDRTRTRVELGTLEISKTPSPDPVLAGRQLTYAIDVENESPWAQTEVTVTDDVPPNTSYVPGSATCGGAESGGVVTFALGALAPGESTTCTFDVVVDARFFSGVDFEDDMESGDAQWTTAAGQGSSNWTLTSNPNQARSPIHSWLVIAGGTVTDQYLISAPFVSNGRPLTFWHYFILEARHDGGVVEISADGGVTWADLGPHFTSNGYNDVISLGVDNPIAGRPAFTANVSTDWVRSGVDLSGFAGDTIQIRFRLATDGSSVPTATGWLVDDVFVGATRVSNTACATSAEGETDCDTARTIVEPVPITPPTANNDSFTTDEDTVLVEATVGPLGDGVLANDTDVESEPLTAVLDTNTSNGALSLNSDGSFTYTPAADFCGADSFTYHADDGIVDSNLATVDIDVVCVNDVPVANNDSYSTNEDTALVEATVGPLGDGVVANDTDVESDPLTSLLDTGPSNGLLVLNSGGSFTYTPGADFCGPDSFTYHANDGTADSTIATVDIDVVCVDDAAVASDDPATVAEDDPATPIDVLTNDTDVDGGPKSIDAVTQPARGTVVNRGTDLTYEPDDDYCNDGSPTDDFTYTLTPGGSTATVQVTVTCLNDAPVANNESFSTDEDTALVEATVGPLGDGVLANDTDVESSPLAAVLDTNASNGALNLNSDGSFTYTPAPDFCGPDSFTYLANDGTADSNVATVSIDVVCVNDPPTVAADDGTVTVNEGAPASNTGTYGDVDGDTVSLSVSIGTIVDEGDGTWSWSYPTDGATPNQAVTVTAEDGNGGSATTTFDLVVTNLPPSGTPDPASQSVQYSDAIAPVAITGTDVAGDSLTVASSWSVDGGSFVAGLPGNLTLTPNGCTTNGQVECGWTLTGVAEVAAGDYVVRVSLSDPQGSSVDVDVVLEVLVEDTRTVFDPANPVAVGVVEDGGTGEPFSVSFDLRELDDPDDVSGDSNRAGDIDLAAASVQLVPVGPGSAVSPTDCASTTAAGDPDPDGGFAYNVVTVRCAFAGVPVNTYTATVTIAGGYYGGGAEDVLVVFDPSLGFTTGGGTYVHPETGERVNFGYTMEYNKKRTNVRGSLLVIRHTPDGVYRLKSNRVEGLALGSEDEFGWASFTGKATYKEPDWDEAVGNYEFVAYAEDHDTPGAGADRFWVTANRDGELAAGLALAAPALDMARLLTGGNIVVPHQGGGGRGGGGRPQ